METITLSVQDQKEATIRCMALANLIGSKSLHYVRYHTDMVYAGNDLTLSGESHTLTVRNHGLDLSYNSLRAKTELDVYGDSAGVAEWYIGIPGYGDTDEKGHSVLPGEKGKYIFAYTLCTGADAVAYLLRKEGKGKEHCWSSKEVADAAGELSWSNHIRRYQEV